MARIEKSIEIKAPVHMAYNQWTQFEEFPRFMEGVREVRQIDDTHLHWRANVGGKDKEWDAEIVEQTPDEVIAWRSMEGAQNSGSVRFAPVPGGNTQLTVVMDYDPQEFVENTSDLLGETSQRVEGDLQRFKDFIESRGSETGELRGEVYQGQPSSTPGARKKQATSAAGTAGSRTKGEQQRAESSTTQEASLSQSAKAKSATGQQSGRSGASLTESEGRSRLPGAFGLWEDSFATVRRMADEMDRMFGGLISGPARLLSSRRSGATVWTPAVEITQQGENIVVYADLPGVRKEDVQIEIQDGMLTIQGERREEMEQQEEEGYRRTERSYGHFYRSIQLPENADSDAAQASMQDGVIEISIPAPRTQRQQGRRLEIQEQ